jgi:spectinomycin phosphotransferase
MRDRPVDLDGQQIQSALTDWGVHAAVLSHVPLGFGDHHWSATDTSGRRWFLTLADLEHKSFLGADPDTVLHRLSAAMDTAAHLHDEGGLGFVVAPLRSAGGETVQRIGERYALSVFPYTNGTPGDFGQTLSPEQRAQVLDTLARLHGRGEGPLPEGRPERHRHAHADSPERPRHGRRPERDDRDQDQGQR